MVSKCEIKENNVAELFIDISVEDFKEALQKAYRKNIKKFSAPGFRKGKVPYGLVIRYYGEGVLYDDAIDFTAIDEYEKAIKEHNLEPVARPELDVLEIGSEKGCKLKFIVTLKPEVKLGQYKDLDAEYKKPSITKKEVDAEIERVRERNSRMLTVEDRAVKAGDFVKIDFEGFLDGEPFAGGKGENYDLEIGSNSFIPGFEDQVIGHKLDEEFDINVSFPEDYQSEDLKGKAVVFKVKINGIQEKEIPVLDDEFVKDVSEFDTVADYKKDVKKQLTTVAKKTADQDYEDKLMRLAAENAEMELPQIMIDEEVEDVLKRQEQRMQSQGIQLAQYLQYLGQTLEEFKKGLEPSVKENLRASLTLEAIVDAEKIKVTKTDLDNHYAEMAENYGVEAEKIKETFAPQQSYIEENIKRKKAMQFIVKNAKKA